MWNADHKRNTNIYIFFVIYGKRGLQSCGKIMNSKDYSTSNYINHLIAAHGIIHKI